MNEVPDELQLCGSHISGNLNDQDEGQNAVSEAIVGQVDYHYQQLLQLIASESDTNSVRSLI